MTVTEKINTLERLVRDGKGEEARNELLSLTRGNVPRPQAVALARLCWRVARPNQGLKLLQPFVRPAPKSPVQATAEEKAEYAQCLTKIGATDEALGILKTLATQSLPRALFYLGAAHMHRWEYGEAIPYLTQYLNVPGVEHYSQLVAKTNLAACYVHERNLFLATALLRELRYETSVARYALLFGNALELSAQCCLLRRQWDEAEAFLEHAASLFRNQQGLDAFFVSKWRAFLALNRAPTDEAALKQVVQVREEALRRSHWETVRDCDRQLAVAMQDEPLYIHLCYGTPFQSFRGGLARDFGRTVTLPPSYDWRLHEGFSPYVIDLAELPRSKIGSLKVGTTPYRLLVVLTSDFYRPFRLGGLFGKIFPGEYFHQQVSPLRIHQAALRLKHWFAENKIPLRISVKEGHYRLEASGPCTVRLCGDPSRLDRRRSQLTLLRERWPDQAFSASDAAKLLRISSSSALRLLNDALGLGDLERQGSRAGARYRFRA